MTSSPRTRAGFTLIELLVVISIIALLIGILLPALGAARRTAKTMQCLANQRQFGIGFTGFALDNKDFLPYGFFSIPDPSEPNGFDQSDWTVEISGYFEGETRNYNDDGVQTSPIMRCPESVLEEGTKTYSAHPILVPTLGFGAPDEQVKWDSQRRPSDIFLTADGVQSPQQGGNAVANPYQLLSGNLAEFVFTKGDPTNFDPLPIGPNVDTNAAEGNLRWRHSGDQNLNLLFMDGHASSEAEGNVLLANVRLDTFPEKP